MTGPELLERLEVLCALDGEAAREIEGCWPLTLDALRAGKPAGFVLLGVGATVGKLARLLDLEIGEAIAAVEEGRAGG